MELYKVVRQLTEEEYTELYDSLAQNKADKSASFLKIIRTNAAAPDKEFLAKFDITAAAFYVLKSRLNQKVESYLLNKVGDPNLDVISRVLKVNEMVFENSRPISIAALNKLEKELTRLDFPYGLMIVYKQMQNLYAFDENHTYYASQYNKQVAYALAMDKAVDLIVQFFKSFDQYMLGRKEEDLQRAMRTMEKISNLNNLYESHRLYIYTTVVHLYGKLFLDLDDELRCELEDTEKMFEKATDILNTYSDDAFYRNIHLLFNLLRYCYYEKEGNYDRAQLYFDILDYKIEELLVRYHLNANTSLFLSSKIKYHIRNNSLPQLQKDVEQYLSNIEVEPYRPAFYVHYQMFLAQSHFLTGNYSKSNKILYNLRNVIPLRKYPHLDLEVRFMLALGYIMVEEFDLANQVIMSLQRQMRNEETTKYAHCKTLLRILTVALGSRPQTRRKNLENHTKKWKETNVGAFAILKEIDLETLFLGE